ncbi:MAG: UDP-N-acetylmuramoyl-L-alanine--D-glutamate ligase [bacterium]
MKGKKILIVGLGKTGIALARLMAQEGALVTVNDIQTEGELDRALKELGDIPYRSALGEHKVEIFLDQDLILASPGVPLHQKAFEAARQRGIPISNDLELAYSLTSAPFIAVSGTNGKTTTTTLIGDIFRQAGRRIILGGNIGFPLSPLVCEQPEAELVIAEVSSFQLELIQTFRPQVGIMLNITPDHLDRYPQWKDYLEAKARLFMNQTPRDFAIINAQDEATPQLSAMRGGHGNVLFFRADGPVEEGIMIQERDVVVRLNGREECMCSLDGVSLAGEHNRQNILAAVLAARLSGIDRDVIQRAIEDFKGLSHRLEFVAEVNGVRFIDDSKGTNVDAVVKAIQGLSGPIWLILGGRDKGNDYGPLISSVKERVKGILAIGESKGKVDQVFRETVPVYCMDSLEEAVRSGFHLASPGDVILLSPACASFDMFDSYAHRGQVFQHIVREMAHVSKNL